MFGNRATAHIRCTRNIGIALIRFIAYDFTRIRKREPVAEWNHHSNHAEEQAPAER